MSKTILITGGAGFIGTALANYLQSHTNHKITLLDLPRKFSKDHKKNFSCYEIDIRKSVKLNRLKNKHFDIIYHLAAQTSGAISHEKPELDVDTNVKGTLNICNYAKNHDCKKIIFSSSMAVYGNKTGKIKENTFLEPISNYGISKTAAEFYIKSLKENNIKFTIFRFFNVYGPGQNFFNMKQGMASIFMSQAIQGKTISVTGSLQRYRDFIYIDDVVSALVMAITRLDNETYNIGSEIKTKVSSLIKNIIACTDISYDKFTIKNIGGHAGDQFGTVANNKKLRAHGWKPKTNLLIGLKKMYADAKHILK